MTADPTTTAMEPIGNSSTDLNDSSNIINTASHSKLNVEDTTSKGSTTLPSPTPTHTPSNSIFNSVDFQKFLNENSNILHKTPSAHELFKSSEFFQSQQSISDLFKSHQSFSTLFASMEQQQQEQLQLKTQSRTSSGSTLPNADLFRSKDWKNLGTHIDVSYSPSVLFRESSSSAASADEGDTATALSLQQQQLLQADPNIENINKTNWGDVFFSQFQPPLVDNVTPPLVDAEAENAVTTPTRNSSPSPSIQSTKTATSTPSDSAKSRRQRKAPKLPSAAKNKAATPKMYVHPTDLDILLGRGGKSNHHPGNKRYREEIKNFQSAYANLVNKEEKTDLSRQVVEFVHQYQGRFLALDKDIRPNRWYEVPDVLARRKVSQALREDDDPVKRKEKRERYLDRKRQKEQDARMRQQQLYKSTTAT